MRVERLRLGAAVHDAGRPMALEGAVLSRDLRVGGEPWAKGRRLSAVDVARLLDPAEVDSTQRPVSLLVLEPGDLHEDEAARRLAAAVARAGSNLEPRGPSESRIDLVATADGVLHVRIATLERIDRIDALEVFTLLDGQAVHAGDVVASVKVAPHVVPRSDIEAAERIAARGGSVVRVAAYRRRRVAALVKESLHAPARTRFETAVREKVEGLGSELIELRYVDDERDAVTEALTDLVRGRRRADLILTAGSASTDPLDPFFQAIDALGGRVVRRGVPAHPGSMLWLARVGRTDILGLPTCGAYSKATAADLLLPRLLSGERADARTVARLGHGGLLTRAMRFRMPAYAARLDAPEG